MCDANFIFFNEILLSNFVLFLFYRKKGAWVGHLLSGYALPMEDPNQAKVDTNSKDIGGTWKVAIKVSYEATKAAFPGGEILAHLDQK